MTKLQIPYARTTVPAFDIPAYSGEWYEDTIPDTLDLTERLRLAVHAATSIADPAADGEVYWLVDFHRNPVVMRHDFNDWVLQLEGILEGVPLARTACGSTENEEIDHAWMANWVLKGIGDDGLLYIPMDGRPWSRMSFLMPGQRAYRPDGTSVPVDDPSVSQIASASRNWRFAVATTHTFPMECSSPTAATVPTPTCPPELRPWSGAATAGSFNLWGNITGLPDMNQPPHLQPNSRDTFAFSPSSMRVTAPG